MTTKNFVVKNGLTVGNVTIDAASGNILALNANLGNLAIANFFSGAGNNLSNIQGANVTGAVASANTAGTVTGNAQANITSLGTLTSLTVSGNTSLGPVANVAITGGTSGQVLSTDGTGNLSFISISSSALTNGNSNVTVLENSNITLSSAGNANVLVVTGVGANVTGTLGVSGNVTAPNFIGNVVGNISGNITIPGSNTGVVFNDDGTANTSTGFTFNKTSNLVTVAGNVSAGNLTTGGALSVTSNANVGNLGTGGLIVATGNIDGGNINTGGLVSATGNVSGGNLTTGGLISATGNITGGNVNTAGKVIASALESNVATGTAPIVVASTTKVTNLNADLLDGYDTDTTATANTVVVRNSDGNITGNNISGTLSTAAQPNITSVGTLTSLDVTGNITSGANVVTDLIVGKTTSVSITATGANSNIFLKPTGTGTVDVWGKIISNVATPIASTDATTKQYVDEVAQGLSPKGSVVAASYAALPAYTYNNGTDGVGATITASANGALTLDGVQPTVGSRVLIKNETAGNAPVNGVYVVTTNNAGAPFVLTRAVDMNIGAEFPGSFVFIETGTVQADTGWVCTSDSPITVGTTAIIFTQFSGAGQYTAGTGLTLTGTVFSISNTAVTAGAYGNGDYNATFTVNQQGQLTAAANVAITANAANLTGTTLSATVVNSSLTSVGTLTSLAVTGNANVGNIGGTNGVFTTVAGTLSTAAQPNITSVGTLTSLTVSGNATVGNLTTGGSGGNISGANVISANTFTASGNITANFFIGNGSQLTGLNTAGVSNGTSNVNIPSANGNVNISSGGNANVLIVTGTGINVAGTLNSTGNANVGNLGTGGLIVATGNITGGNLVTGGSLSVTGNATVGNLTTAGGSGGNISNANVISANTFTASGNVSAGNVTVSGLTSLGAVGNVSITGGSNGQVLTTNGSGGLSFVSISSSSISNGNSNVSIPSANGNVNISAVGTANVVVVTGTGANITGTLNVTGNATVGNLIASGGGGGNITGANLVSANFFTGTLTTAAQPNITSVGTLTSLAVTGNISSGNANLGNLATANFVTGTLTTNAQPNITSVGTLTSLDVTGNLSSGNANLGNLATANFFTGTLTTNAQPNITSVGTLTSLSVTGNVSTGNVSASTATASLVNLTTGLTTNRSNVAVTSATVIDSFDPTAYRTAKYVISASGDNGYQSVETLLVHDGVDAYITIYGSVCSNVTADIIELTSNVNGVSGNVTVYASSSSANALVNLVASYIKT
jgi:hypothetical protein